MLAAGPVEVSFAIPVGRRVPNGSIKAHRAALCGFLLREALYRATMPLSES